MTAGEVLAGCLGGLWLLAHACGAVPRTPEPPPREPVVVYPPPVPPRRTP